MDEKTGQKFKVFIIIEPINMILTILFLIIFALRFLRLRHIGNTDKHIHKYPKIRIIFSICYVIISVTFIITYLITVEDLNIIQFLFQGGVGECINSLILVIHILVLKQQLAKQKTYTRFHLIYMIYLSIISIARLAFSIGQAIVENRSTYVLLTLSAMLAFISFCMLLLWLKKRKQLPVFIDHGNMTEQGFANLTSHLSLAHLSIQRLNKFNKRIFSTVMVQKNKIRIILESSASNDILKSRTYDVVESERMNSVGTISSTSPNRHLQIISTRLYTIEDIKNIYIQCNRFNIRTKLDFKNMKMSRFYQDLKNYLDELFSLKKSYVPEILSLFSIQDQDITQIHNKIKIQCNNQLELDICQKIDQNAIFLSVSIFKNFWADDHFIFYIHIRSTDFNDQATIHKRYKDFEEFHETIQKILADNDMSDYKLPQLPKKHLFGWDISEMVIERQKYLEFYCRDISNDFQLMNNLPAAKEYILNFFGLKKIVVIYPDLKKHQNYYEGITIQKGNILQALLKYQYVTFYQFKILKNGVYSHTITRRFQEFVHLHEILERWMNNIKICYKFLVLPDKILFKSEQSRHEKLKKYLEGVFMANYIYKVYGVTYFLNLAQVPDQENSSNMGLSIKKSSEEGTFRDQSMESHNRSSSRHGSRISQLIQQLIIE